ncbi:MAG: glycosyltransferase family 2 protein, partial [Nitrospira sp.]|nr:glycosyltransferase family 2 protein [Nitrospira sp.]
QETWQGYAKQKQAGIDKASSQWVLVLDADERVTPGLKSEILQAISENRCAGFYLPRKNFFLGRWIRYSGWWPDYTLRLFKKEKGFMEDREVHEKIVVNGITGYMKNPMEHYTYRTLTDFLKKMEEYADLSSRELEKKGNRPGLISLALRPLFTFTKMFFLRKGFLDGSHGLILAILYGYYTFLKYAKVWEKVKKW